MGLKTFNEADSYLQDKGATTNKKIRKPEVKTPRIFPNSYLSKLIPQHDYWINRGVSEETLRLFQGGLVKEGTMANRYVFPILNSKKELTGISGRCILGDQSNKSRPKWKHRGSKSHWKYPLQANFDILKKEKEFFLVESIGDMLSLWDAGIKNVLVIFGLNVPKGILNFLLKVDPTQVILSLNNDSGGNSAGNNAAQKNYKKMLKYFDKDQIMIHLPTKNDFGEMSHEEIRDWKLSLDDKIQKN